MGAHGALWVTEQDTGRISRVRPSDGAKTTLLEIPEAFQTDPGAQAGLLGMALEPAWSRRRRHRHVYVAYAYDADADPHGVDPRVKIRVTRTPRAARLTAPVDVITGMPASNDHNSGRLAFGPDGKLYYTIGDQGANQFRNACERNRAQDLPTADQVRARDWQTYQGKILRPDRDGSIPPDNPVIAGVRSHVYSYGHRNAQGIVFGPDGQLYSVEHGPKSDDELNVIRPGGNYGWPTCWASATTRPTCTRTGRTRGSSPAARWPTAITSSHCGFRRRARAGGATPTSRRRSDVLHRPDGVSVPRSDVRRTRYRLRLLADDRAVERRHLHRDARRARLGELTVDHVAQARHRVPPEARRHAAADR